MIIFRITYSFSLKKVFMHQDRWHLPLEHREVAKSLAELHPTILFHNENRRFHLRELCFCLLEISKVEVIETVMNTLIFLYIWRISTQKQHSLKSLKA